VAPHSFELKGADREEALKKFGGTLPDISHQRVWWNFEAGSSTGSAGAAAVDESKSDEDVLRKEMTYEGVEKSLLVLEAFIQTQGPFDGIIGFSQGAAMAAILIDRLRAKQGFQFKFACFISG
jgi:hypothetical protein